MSTPSTLPDRLRTAIAEGRVEFIAVDAEVMVALFDELRGLRADLADLAGGGQPLMTFTPLAGGAPIVLRGRAQ